MANSRRAILPGANSMIFGGINPHKNTLTCMIFGRKIPCGIRSFTGDYFMETTNSNYFGTEKISRILLKIAPPVMLAQLIQALYNIVDSLFVGKYSESGLTALSIIYPLQLLMIAIAVGTGVGINTAMAHYLGVHDEKKANEYGGIGTPLTLVLWVLFAAVCFVFMPAYARMSTDSAEVIKDVIVYGRIVCVFSIGLFTESIWTKILQANGDMKTPMIAQIAGALVNIALDPLFIFGLFGLPKLGIAGAAIATVVGQIVAALIVMKKGFRKSPPLSVYPRDICFIYKLGIPNILMQSAYTFYILGLNLILATFSDQAVTELGLYYKWQSFFFIPLGALQTCIVPVISYNYASGRIDRCKKTLSTSLVGGMGLMFIGTLVFNLIPGQMLRVFTSDPQVITIGMVGFHFVGISFIPMVTSLIFPVFFQAVGAAVKSSLLTVVRTVVLFVPLGYLFSRLGLNDFWFTFPVTEVITTLVGVFFYRRFMAQQK
jgi:putative MATE family efflux protein